MLAWPAGAISFVWFVLFVVDSSEADAPPRFQAQHPGARMPTTSLVEVY